MTQDCENACKADTAAELKELLLAILDPAFKGQL
jgi:hypothetical protein